MRYAKTDHIFIEIKTTIVSNPTQSQNQSSNFISLQEASEATGYHQDYLGSLARNGKLNAQKIGRNWVTTNEAIEELLKHGSNHISGIDAVDPKEASPYRAEILANLKNEVITNIARKVASETVLQKIDGINGSTQKLDEKVEKLRVDFQSEFERLFDKKLAQASVVAAALSRKGVAASDAKGYDPSKFENTSATLFVSPVQRVNGTSAGLGIEAPRLNLDKIQKSFKHRFDLAKYFAYALTVITLLLGSAIVYDHIQTQRQLSDILNREALILVKQSDVDNVADIRNKQVAIGSNTAISGPAKFIYIQGKPGLPGFVGIPSMDGASSINGISAASSGITTHAPALYFKP
ncbi:MAG: hypothetical protein NVSMB66_6860 [Candidatus Doudnabacteria bacterium]